jgi:hypothetical protein
MATVTGITAEAAEAVLGQSIVSGTISESGHLILTRDNGQQIDAGDFTNVILALIEDVFSSTVAFKNTRTGTLAPDQVPATVSGMDLQSASLIEFKDALDAVLAKISATGAFSAHEITNTSIDGDLNTTKNLNASKIDTHKVTVSSAAPASPAAGDIWIQTTGV